MPLLGYTAVGFKRIRSTRLQYRATGIIPGTRAITILEGLGSRIHSMLRRFPDNRILRQLARCSLQYGCFTAQNIFYQRWEAGIPTTPACNADCLGCISEQHGEVDSPQHRLDFRARGWKRLLSWSKPPYQRTSGHNQLWAGLRGRIPQCRFACCASKSHTGATPCGTININSHGAMTNSCARSTRLAWMLSG